LKVFTIKETSVLLALEVDPTKGLFEYLKTTYTVLKGSLRKADQSSMGVNA